MVNTSLLEATMAHIVAHPELHDQLHYFAVNEFGIAACFAGRALLLAGYGTTLPLREGAYSVFAQHPETKETVAAGEEARKVLGLTRFQAGVLFSSTNCRSMLDSAVQGIVSIERERICDLIPE